jgi:hypothetical protein
MPEVMGKSLWIAVKIWFFAVLFNTIISAIIFLHPFDEVIFFIMIVGAIYGAVYSLPVFFILFIVLIVLAEKKSSYFISMTIILCIGVGGAMICSYAFQNRGPGMNFLYITATASGFAGIMTQSISIKKLLRRENLLDQLLKPEQNENDMV